MEIIIGVVIIGFLFGALYYLKKISEQQTQILRRIEVIELLSHEGGKEVERDDIENPGVGLPIGAPVPEIHLEDITGKRTELTTVLKGQIPSVLFFVSPSCNPCQSLLPEIESWQEDLKGKLDFVFISNGTAKENLEKFGGDSFKTILLQKEREAAEELMAKWTPTAILINPDGTIASKVAAGDSAIKELVEKVKENGLEEEFIYIAKGENGTEPNLGKEAPEFELKDLDGKEFSNKNLVNGKKTLVAFWSTTCPHCVNMLDELREWDKGKGQDEPDLILLSAGDEETHREMELNSTILLEENGETARAFGMSGTPSAVMISKDGKIVSETAVGAPNIWALLGRKK
jgi:thiol-disulfide isomerase/thioredoxin